MQRKWQGLLKPYTEKSNSAAIQQIFNTLIPYFGLWVIYAKFGHISVALNFLIGLAMALFTLRCFVLMHDCGHGSLFSSASANKIVGYFLGVLTGMPQYVWSKHHAYHHLTNGDWEKYHGPLNIVSVKEYSALSKNRQRIYWWTRHPSLLWFAGFYYVFFNPRFTWIFGSLKWTAATIGHWIYAFFGARAMHSKPNISSPWKTSREYLHMTYNNLALLPLWAVMVEICGAFHFFVLYIPMLTLSGALGILFFIVQHNFEGSYASDTANVDSTRAVIEGTSFLVLPKILNWFTASIGYHHVHHLSAAIPNYRLVACHNALSEHFAGVRRLYLRGIPENLGYQLWDSDRQIIVSRKEYAESNLRIRR